METVNHECYVSLEVAKLLKEAGFNWTCRGYFNDTEFHPNGSVECTNYNSNTCKYLKVPVLEVAQRWLREDKKLDISIHYDPTIKSQPYAYFIYDMEEKFDDILGIISPVTHSYSDGYFYTYEEAQESGIKKAVEILLKEGE